MFIFGPVLFGDESYARSIPAFRGVNKAGTTLSENTQVTIPFSTDFDTRKSFDGNLFVAPESGFYHIDVRLVIESGHTWVSGDYFQVGVVKNGNTTGTFGELVCWNDVYSSNSNELPVTCGGLVHLAKGDELEIQGFYRKADLASVDLKMGSNWNVLSISMIEPTSANGLGDSVVLKAVNGDFFPMPYNSEISYTYAIARFSSDFRSSLVPFVAPEAGFYHVDAHLQMVAGYNWASGDYVRMEFELNNVGYPELSCINAITASHSKKVTVGCRGVMQLVKGDELRVKTAASKADGVAPWNSPYNNYLSVIKLK
jgi:hypothetical protein